MVRPNEALREQLPRAAAAQPESLLLPSWVALLEGRATFSDILELLRKQRQLTYLTIDTTGACDLTCAQMCYYNPGISLRKPLVPESVLTDAIRQAAAELSMRVLAFAGKEPFLNPERLFSLLEFAGSTLDREYVIGVVTNGRHIGHHAQRLQKAAETGCLDYVDVSIDSSHPEEHDRFRGIAGTHRLATDAVNWLNRELKGVRTTVVSVLRWENHEAIPELIQSLAEQNLNYQIQPIQPPPYSSISPLSADFIVRFVERLTNALTGPLRGAGVRVSIELLGIYLLEAVRAGVFRWSDIREDGNRTLYVERSVGGNTLIVTCELFPLQAWRLARITYSGAYLAHMHFLQAPDPDQFAVGFLGRESIGTLFDRAMEMGGHFARTTLSRVGHDCASRPCWWNCFGGWNGAENAFLDLSPRLSDQPRLCTKTGEDFVRLESEVGYASENLL